MNRFLYLFLLFTANISAQTFTELVKSCEKSVFTVITYNEDKQPFAFGTGFFINSKGYGVSNVHVFKNASYASIQTIDKKEFEIDSIVLVDEAADICVFAIKGLNKVSSYLSITNPEIEKGEEVFVIGTPKGLEYTVSKGILSSIRNIDGYGKTIQFTAPISSGNSGSPLINMKGQIIGIVTFQLSEGQNLNFATDINRVTKSGILKKQFRFNGYFFNSTYEDYFNKGLIEMARDSFNLAITYFTKEIKRNPISSEAFFQRAFSKQKNKDYEGSIADYNSGIKISPKDRSALLLRGFVKYMKGDFKGCIEDQNKSLAIGVDEFALFLKADSYYKLNDYPNALLVINQSIKKFPEYHLPYFDRGLIKISKEDYHGAMADFNKVITLDQDFGDAYTQRGECKFYLKDYRGAIEDYTKKIELADKFPLTALQGRSKAYVILQNWTKAIEDCNLIIENDPSEPDAYFLRGVSKFNTQDIEGGCLDFSKAGELGDKSAYEYIQKYCK